MKPVREGWVDFLIVSALFWQDAYRDGKADPWDIEDAIYSAANYLAKNGADEGRLRDAVNLITMLTGMCKKCLVLRINTLKGLLKLIKVKS